MNEYFKGNEKKIFEATWQWILDHSDLKSDGQLFVKANIKNKKKFANSVRYRMKGYYRDILKTDEHLKSLSKNETIRNSIRENLKIVELENNKIIKDRNSFIGRLKVGLLKLI